MKAIVTGGAGFIGCNLAKQLLHDGWSVNIIDNLSTGNVDNIFNYVSIECVDNKLNYFKKDFCDEGDLDFIFNQNIPDVIFHVGALPRVQFSIEYPLKTNKSNVNGTLLLLEKAAKIGVKRFVYSSSSSVYGDQNTLPLEEGMKPNPMSPYALQKLTGEEYCRLYNLIYGMETISLRYFNVYGPRQNADGGYAILIPKFIKLMKDGQTPIINGDGKQSRDFTYVDDVVNVNILAAMTNNKKCFGKTFNIGGGNSKSVNEVVAVLSQFTGFKGNIKHGPPVLEPKHTLADISLAKELLGWEPKSDFYTELEKLCKE